MSALSPVDLEDLFPAAPDRPILVITVGNTLRGDDGVGPYIAKHLLRTAGNIVLLDAGERPENVVDKAIEQKPARTVIIDAADFGGRPGELRLIPEEAVSETTLSTHRFPLVAVGRLIAGDTGSEVYYLGIQQVRTGYEEGLSLEVKETADEIIARLSR